MRAASSEAVELHALPGCLERQAQPAARKRFLTELTNADG